MVFYLLMIVIMVYAQEEITGIDVDIGEAVVMLYDMHSKNQPIR
jgi:hypothetical protein